MKNALARFETVHASKYLQQLCKHFSHKIPAEWTPDKGWAHFPAGQLALEARDGALIMACTAQDDERLTNVAKLTAVHLERFAFREAVSLVWLEDGIPADALNARLRAMPDPHGEHKDDPDADAP